MYYNGGSAILDFVQNNLAKPAFILYVTPCKKKQQQLDMNHEFLIFAHIFSQYMMSWCFQGDYFLKFWSWLNIALEMSYCVCFVIWPHVWDVLAAALFTMSRLDLYFVMPLAIIMMIDSPFVWKCVYLPAYDRHCLLPACFILMMI